MSSLADIEQGLQNLDEVFTAVLNAALPTPAALTFSERIYDLHGRRDLLYALGLLNEGENEAALIVTLARDALRSDPGFDAGHLAREAWYYLRTSIDPAWQIDDGEPSMPVALQYLSTVLRERLATIADGPRPRAVAGNAPTSLRRALLERLRSERHSSV